MRKKNDKLQNELRAIVGPYNLFINDSRNRFVGDPNQLLKVDYTVGSWDTAHTPTLGYVRSWDGVRKLLKESRLELADHELCGMDDCFVYDTEMYCDERPQYNIWVIEIND